jgi:hypothetical protein
MLTTYKASLPFKNPLVPSIGSSTCIEFRLSDNQSGKDQLQALMQTQEKTYDTKHQVIRC